MHFLRKGLADPERVLGGVDGNCGTGHDLPNEIGKRAQHNALIGCDGIGRRAQARCTNGGAQRGRGIVDMNIVVALVAAERRRQPLFFQPGQDHVTDDACRSTPRAVDDCDTQANASNIVCRQ